MAGAGIVLVFVFVPVVPNLPVVTGLVVVVTVFAGVTGVPVYAPIIWLDIS